jgi:hypothetical protein
MAAKGKAYENPVAERMIGILKDEYGLDQKFRSIADAEKAIDWKRKSYPHIHKKKKEKKKQKKKEEKLLLQL